MDKLSLGPLVTTTYTESMASEHNKLQREEEALDIEQGKLFEDYRGDKIIKAPFKPSRNHSIKFDACSKNKTISRILLLSFKRL